MTTAHFVTVAALGFASCFTGLVLAFVLRARRLNHADRCGLCAEQLALETRFRFHGRSVCERCSRRVRFITVPRVGRITVLLGSWAIGAIALTFLIERRDPEALIWGPLFGGLVVAALMAGALPPLTKSRNHTAATLQRLSALLHTERRRED